MQKKKILKQIRRHFVYILRCSDGTLYTGYTVDLKKRLALHNKGRGAKYLRGKLPVAMVFAKTFKNYKNALKEERSLKTKSKRQKENFIKIFERKIKKFNLNS